jgi:hypothetical protein
MLPCDSVQLELLTAIAASITNDTSIVTLLSATPKANDPKLKTCSCPCGGGLDTSTVTLRVVRGDEKGTQPQSFAILTSE